MHILAVLAALLIPAIGWSQVACFNYGTIISCDSSGGVNTTITPFTREQGIIQYRSPDGGGVTPYTVFEAPASGQDLNRAIAPLRPLPSVGSSPFDGELPPDLDLGFPPMELR